MPIIWLLCRNYHGVQIENPEVGIGIQGMQPLSIIRLVVKKTLTIDEPVCTSPEAFLKVVTNKELYDSMVDALAATRIGDPEHYYGVCVSDPIKALEGPYQEVSRSFLFVLREAARRELIFAAQDLL